MEKPESPCARCTERTLRCHGRCERYMAFQQQNRAYNRLVAANTGQENRVKYSKSRLNRMYK